MEQPGADVEDGSSDEGGAHAEPDPPGFRVHGACLQDALASRHAKCVGERVPARRQKLVDGDGCGKTRSKCYGLHTSGLQGCCEDATLLHMC